MRMERWIAATTLREVPVIVANDGAFGVHSNQFGFSVDGVPGWICVVEHSTDLLQWFPVQTNTLSSSRFYFSDPDYSQTSHRFYRARLWP